MDRHLVCPGGVGQHVGVREFDLVGEHVRARGEFPDAIGVVEVGADVVGCGL